MRNWKAVWKTGVVAGALCACCVFGGNLTANAAENSEMVKSQGKVGQYEVTTHISGGNTTLYVTDKKTNKKVKVAKGDVSTNAVVSGDTIFYVQGNELLKKNCDGSKSVVIDSELKTKMESSIRIMACQGGNIYYGKALDKNFEKQGIYQYDIAKNSKNLCFKQDFSYETQLDVNSKNIYVYATPTDVGSSYTMFIRNVNDGKVVKELKKVCSHFLTKSNLYYSVNDAKKKVVTYYKADLNGKNSKKLSSADYGKLAKKYIKNNGCTLYQPVKYTSKYAKFMIISDGTVKVVSKNAKITFSTGKVVVK